MKWLTVLGLTFQFVAFWFAAPELLGENALKRMQAGIQKLVTWIPILFTLLVVLGYGFTFVGISLYNTYKMAQTGEVFIDPTKYFVSLGVFTSIYMVFIFRYKKISKWLENNVAIPLTDKILNSSTTRKNALVVGAILFTLGFLIQISLALIQ